MGINHVHFYTKEGEDSQPVLCKWIFRMSSKSLSLWASYWHLTKDKLQAFHAGFCSSVKYKAVFPIFMYGNHIELLVYYIKVECFSRDPIYTSGNTAGQLCLGKLATFQPDSFEPRAVLFYFSYFPVSLFYRLWQVCLEKLANGVMSNCFI